MTLILGIETSCDETSAAVVEDGRAVRSNLIASQFDLHKRYGGVVPEIAARAHIERLDLLVREAMNAATVTPLDIDAIAVTNRPGLIGALLVGVTAAKALAWGWNKPLIDVNHIHAHATSAAIEPGESAVEWPAVSLVVSGGHTSLFLVRDPLNIERLGRTLDDAAGEAFDKVAAMLDLGFPGGPIVDKRAAAGNTTRFKFPRTLLEDDSLDFSFSGLKTAVLYQAHGPGKSRGGLERWSPADIDDLCASFSATAVDVLIEKTMRAVRQTGVKTVVVGGGVAANRMLRARLTEACAPRKLRLHLTPMKYCTDNAAMIAAQGYCQFAAGQFADWSLSAAASA